MTLRQYIILSVLLVVLPANIYAFYAYSPAAENTMIILVKLMFSAFIIITCNGILKNLASRRRKYLLFMSIATGVAGILFVVSASYRSLLPLYTLVWFAMLGAVIWVPKREPTSS
jgi:hypothetical protein